MPFSYEYINKFKQLSIINYTLRIIDSQENSSDIFIPVVLSESEDTEENLNNIALDMINRIISDTQQEKNIFTDNILNDSMILETETKIIELTEEKNNEILIPEEIITIAEEIVTNI